MGVDVAAFLDETARMVDAIRSAPAASNPGVSLGLLLGTAAVAGRDKLTLIASPGIEGLGAWLEQLVAESTGKNGQSIVPVDLEALAPPDRYGADRVFVYLRLATAPDAAQDAGVAALEAAGAAGRPDRRRPPARASARSSSAGRSPRRSRRTSCASTRSTSRTSRRARSRRRR